MSTTSQPTNVEETYDCTYCDDEFPAPTAVAGSFCSTSCHRAHRREKRVREVFREIEQDHRFCATCGRQLKTVDKPNTTVVVGPSRHQEWDHAKDVLVGYQYRTEHAETGEISLDVDEAADRPIVEDGVATGTVCKCGNTAHQHEEPILQGRFPFTTAYYVARAARVLREEGKHDVRLDLWRLFDAVLKRDPLRDALAHAVVLDD